MDTLITLTKKQIFYVLMLLLVTVTFSSCKKSVADIPLGTIKCKINGSDATFNRDAKGTNLNVTGGFGIKIQGFKKEASLTDLELTVAKPTVITAKTYVEDASGLVTISHFVDLFFGSGTTTTSYISTTNPVVIVITEITTTTIKGTFKGDLQGSSTTGGASPFKEVISDGVFYVSF